MGQGWNVIAVECRERWAGQGGLKLGEFFWDWRNCDIVRQLKRPHWEDDVSVTAHWSRLPTRPKGQLTASQTKSQPHSKAPAPAPHTKARARSKAQLPAPQTRYRLRQTASRMARISAAPPPTRAKDILSLPVELVHIIFTNFEDVVDVFSMCLAHESLGAVGEPLFHKLIAEQYAPWARQKLLCAGSGIRDDDLPPGLECLAAQDIKELIPETSRYEGRRDNGFFSEVAGNFYEARGGPPGGSFLRYEWPRGTLTEADEQKLEQLMAKLHAAQRQDYEPEDAEDKPLVLYNLSKRVYVREAPIEELRQRLMSDRNFPHQGIDFSHVLLSQICWSSDRGCAMGDVDSERLSRGPWAGDHFEVMYAGKSRARLDSEEWKDVTDDIIPWIEELWEDTWV